MSLRIDPEKVTAVLLADGWHDAPGFAIDDYEFVDDMDYDLLGGGDEALISTRGFRFWATNDNEEGTVIAGPLTSVIAVRYDR